MLKQSRRIRWFLAAVVLAGQFCLAMPTQADNVSYTWIAGDGDWCGGATWSPAAPPTYYGPGLGDTAIINNGATVTSTHNVWLYGLEIGAGSTVAVSNNTYFGLNYNNPPGTPAYYRNDGIFRLDSTGGNASFFLGSGTSTTTLNGTGSLVLGGNINNWWSEGPFVNAATHTVQGGGTIGANISLTNYGLILANNQILRIAAQITNQGSGRLATESGAVMELTGQAGVTGGTLSAGEGTVKLYGGGTLTGNPTLTSFNPGKIEWQDYYLKGPATINALANIIVNKGTSVAMMHLVKDANGNDPTLTNNGTIRVKSTGSTSSMYANYATVTLTGTGSVILEGNDSRLAGGGTGSYINDIGHTIRGTGLVEKPVVNNGAIMAENGWLTIYNVITGTGSVTVADNATLGINRNFGGSLSQRHLEMSRYASLYQWGGPAIELKGNFLFAQQEESRWSLEHGITFSGQGPQQRLEVGGHD